MAQRASDRKRDAVREPAQVLRPIDVNGDVYPRDDRHYYRDARTPSRAERRPTRGAYRDEPVRRGARERPAESRHRGERVRPAEPHAAERPRRRRTRDTPVPRERAPRDAAARPSRTRAEPRPGSRAAAAAAGGTAPSRSQTRSRQSRAASRQRREPRRARTDAIVSSERTIPLLEGSGLQVAEARPIPGADSDTESAFHVDALEAAQERPRTNKERRLAAVPKHQINTMKEGRLFASTCER